MSYGPNNVEYFMIKALPDPNESECLDSFALTIGENVARSEIKVVKELSCREETLNKILTLKDKDTDLFFFVDDIRFKDGWWESLQETKLNADIVGFSMVSPKTGLLQDFGYDFVKIDGELSYRGLYKHLDPDFLDLAPFRDCASVCGCAMWISNRVLTNVNEFSFVVSIKVQSCITTLVLPSLINIL